MRRTASERQQQAQATATAMHEPQNIDKLGPKEKPGKSEELETEGWDSEQWWNNASEAA